MGKFKSVYTKNFITMVLVLSLSFLMLGMSYAVISYQVIVRDKEESMERNAEITSSFLSTYFSSDSVQDNKPTAMKLLEVKSVMSWLSHDLMNVDIMLADSDGMVVLCSDDGFSCEHMGKFVSERILDGINREGMLSQYERTDGLFGSKRYIVGTVLESAGYSGYLFLSGESDQLAGVWRSFAVIFIFAALAVVAITFVGGYLATRHQAMPLREMTEAARRFGRGDFSARVHETDRCDEIGELAYAFNKMADSLENSEKARRELIANVSHELKTPMTTITGFADGILDGTIPQDKQRDYLSIISSETKRLSRLVRGMLDMSQIQEKKKGEILKKRFDISEVIRVALLSLEQKITSRGIDVDVSLPEEAVMTMGDADSITQVVYNLIDNASKFASKGSAIKLELWKQDGKAYVSIANYGETISKEELPLIFDRFHKTDKSRSMDKDGVGLGLYIVKTILDSHGEDIFVTSKDGLTTFTFTLTLALDEPKGNSQKI